MPANTCPICQRAMPKTADNPAHPFCSKRCKLVDLGNWLSDRYVIPAAPTDGQDLDALGDEELAACWTQAGGFENPHE
jgi:endogenous inhibitor of DNA gyrase (YacG/DUF329 family)